ncbi:bacterial transcriptional activator domain-containing protein [Catenulispora pinisilvae]|uniref:bacterial transcriptional activator domain-containing protein n=1 Tax=Catenulispora pinisilvae TaxID=2705253 RepID=UPI0018917DB8|nr:bacterial transcriptional activator domain-containing protein [Catenulispora pinisilvae]
MARIGEPNPPPDPGVQRQLLAPQGPPRTAVRQQPVSVGRRRSFGDVIGGLAALILLAALVVGVPLALAALIGWPLPHKMPDARFFNSTINASTFTNILAVLVWIAWAQFTACVVVEVVATIRGIGMPGHVPLSGGSQVLARRLVAAVLLITASTASFAPGLSTFGQHSSDPPRPTISVSAGVHVDATIGDVARTADSASHPEAPIPTQPTPGVGARVSGATKFYRVVPPQGRHHDSLWEIAQRHLGDGRRYQEIYELNKDKVQPDGSKLTKASLIRPGWILEMPADAHGGDLVEEPSASTAPATPPATAPATAPNARTESTLTQVAQSLSAIATTAGTGVADGAGQQVLDSSATQPLTPISLVQPHLDAGRAAQSQPPASNQTPFRLPYEILASPLLAAGLLAALGRNRRRQLWNRAFGRRLPVADTQGAGVEEALRLSAEAGEVRFLDRALRELAAAASAAQIPLPAVFAARSNGEGLELLLTEPSPRAPAPWTARADGRAWFIARASVGTMPDATVSPASAPYPGLVSIGVDGAQSRRFLDLEAAAGVICVDGDQTKRRAVLAAIAVELATNAWSDRMTVTLVGFPGDLTPLAPGRIHQVANLGQVLPLIRMEVEERRRALEHTGRESVLSGRLGASSDAVPPHFIISAEPPDPGDSAALADLAHSGNRIGIGCLIAGDVPAAVWHLTVDAAGRLTAPLLDLDVQAHSLPDEQYTAVLELFTATTDWSGVPLGQTAPEAAAIQTRFSVTPTVSVGLLGDLEVTGVGDLEPERRQLVSEALTFLMLHRGGANPTVLASALWPRGVSTEVADAVLTRLGAWLGKAPDGSPNLLRLPDGRVTTGLYVRSDWEMFADLRAVANHDPRFSDPADRDRVLDQTLGLVRGPLLAGRDPGRYGWLAYESVEAEVPAVIADTAVELCGLRLAAGNAEGAVKAVRSGMLASPADEELWRALLRATHATGDTARLEAVVNALWQQTLEMPGDRGLHPKTEALVEELLPTWQAPAMAGG